MATGNVNVTSAASFIPEMWGWQTELWHEYDSPQFRELHALIFLERYNKGAKNLKKNLPGYNQDDYNKDLQFFMKKIQETPLLGE